MKLTTAALAPYHALAPRSQGFGPTIIGTPGHGRLLALTYDDGPNKRWTPALLEILARHGLKATFFVVGKYVEERPDLVQRAVAEGHEIGNHTYSHANLLFLSEAQIGEDNPFIHTSNDTLATLGNSAAHAAKFARLAAAFLVETSVDALFRDDFETGDTTRWSDTIP